MRIIIGGKGSATQIYHSALCSLDAANNNLGSPYPGPVPKQRARETRDYLLSYADGITLLERLRRAAAEEAEREERTL